MRVVADLGKCEGYANCIVASPDVFDLDEEFIVSVTNEQPGEEKRPEVEDAVRSCPAGALALVEH